VATSPPEWTSIDLLPFPSSRFVLLLAPSFNYCTMLIVPFVPSILASRSLTMVVCIKMFEGYLIYLHLPTRTNLKDDKGGTERRMLEGEGKIVSRADQKVSPILSNERECESIQSSNRITLSMRNGSPMTHTPQRPVQRTLVSSRNLHTFGVDEGDKIRGQTQRGRRRDNSSVPVN